MVKMKKIIFMIIAILLNPCISHSASRKVKESDLQKEAMRELKKFPCYAFNSQNLQVKPNYGIEKIDRSKSLNGINSNQGANVIANDHVAVGDMTLAGYISVKMSTTANAPIRLIGQQLKASNGQEFGKYCIYLDKFVYNVGIEEATIVIPKDYLYNSCEYNIILKHEQEHLKIYRQAISKYSMKAYTDLLNYLKNYKGAMVFYNKEQAMNTAQKLNDTLSKLVITNHNALQSEAKYENWMFDDREYRLPSFKTRCSN